jgi:hypothetical protein
MRELVAIMSVLFTLATGLAVVSAAQQDAPVPQAPAARAVAR